MPGRCRPTWRRGRPGPAGFPSPRHGLAAPDLRRFLRGPRRAVGGGRARSTEPGGSCLLAVASGDFPPGTVVDLPGGRRPPGWRLAVVSDDHRPIAVEVALPGAPLLWYVELPEPAAAPAATTLVAFSDDRYAEGRLLHADDARRAGIAADGQVAALRWWPATGLVHQVYVSPTHRRRGVGHKLVRAAFGLQAARGLQPLHGDGRRTDLGEQWRQALPDVVATRMAVWSQRLPAMDPAPEQVALSAR